MAKRPAITSHHSAAATVGRVPARATGSVQPGRQPTGGRASHSLPTNEYDATRDQKRRRAPPSSTKSEDQMLLPGARRRLVSSARDLRRNFTVAAWAIRKHLDFIANFTFQARTRNPAFNRALELQMNEWALPQNFDAAGLHSRQRFLRILEGCAVVDGDVGAIPQATGRLQAVEGDRVRTPEGEAEGTADAAGNQIVHGVRINSLGRPTGYLVCKRTAGNGFVLDKEVPAPYFFNHGYYDRFDQVRGITPMSTSINEFQDLYEARVYALMKAKVSQLFGIKFKRAEGDPLGGSLTSDTTTRSTDYSAIWRQAVEAAGVPVLDMDPGDDAEFMANATPSNEFQTFDDKIIHSAIKSLDLPFSFYDESFTNFFGSKAALQGYLYAADIKRANLAGWLDRYTRWRTGLAVATDELVLPGAMQWADLDWEWVPTGLPWWRPLEEVKSSQLAIAIGMSSTPDECKGRGEDAYEIVDRQAKYEIYKAGKVKEVTDAGGTWPTGPNVGPASADEPTSTEKQLDGEDGQSGSGKKTKGGSK